MNYEKLRRLMFERHSNKLTVSKGANISYPTLVNWEQGRSTPSLKTVSKLANYFGVPVSYFLDD